VGLAHWLGSSVIRLGNRGGRRRREDCNGAKQRYGNRGGVDTVCDFRFHSAFGDLLVYLFLRNFLHSVAKKLKNPLRPSTQNTDRVEGGTRQTLQRKIGRIKLRLGNGYGA